METTELTLFQFRKSSTQNKPPRACARVEGGPVPSAGSGEDVLLAFPSVEGLPTLRACGQSTLVKAPMPAFLSPLIPPAHLLEERFDYMGPAKLIQDNPASQDPQLHYICKSTGLGIRMNTWGWGHPAYHRVCKE